jgi:hypothetical protein
MEYDVTASDHPKIGLPTMPDLVVRPDRAGFPTGNKSGF